MRKLLLFFLLISILPAWVSAQDFNYVQYDTKDGLAGSTVYDMCQDKEGFLWFATENGLSRYDGTHFRNFTVKDGLPDNEVLKIFADTRGRVWIGSFNKELCYYFQGKLYNRENSALLSQINLTSAAQSIFDDEYGNIIIGDRKKIYEVSKNDNVLDIGSQPVFTEHYLGKYTLNKNYFGKGFLVLANDSVFKYINDRLIFWVIDKEKDSDTVTTLKRFRDGRAIRVKCIDSKLSHSYENAELIYLNTVNGAWSVDTTVYALQTHFLPGKRVSNTINDSEGNIWFATMGEGVFKLPSAETKTIRFPKASNTNNAEVFCLAGYNNEVICGLGFSKAGMVGYGKPYKILDYGRFTGSSPNNLSTNRLYCSKSLPDGGVALGFDAYLVRIDKTGKALVNSELVAIKSIDVIDKEHMLVGGYSNTLVVRTANLTVVDIIWSAAVPKCCIVVANII